MDFREQFTDYVGAGYTGLWVRTPEIFETQQLLMDIARETGMRVLFWDAAALLDVFTPAGWVDEDGKQSAEDHRAASTVAQWNVVLDTFRSSNKVPPNVEPANALLVLRNGHWLVKKELVIQNLSDLMVEGKQTMHRVVVLSHKVDIPAELRLQFQVLDHGMPTRDEVKQIAKEMDEAGLERLQQEDLERVVDAASGLTHSAAENALALSLFRHSDYRPRTIFEQKADMLKEEESPLTLYTGKETFAEVGGLDYMKQYCLQVLNRREANPKFRGRGIIIMGVSGGGKSLFAKALGNETDRPTLELNVGKLMDKYVGESDANLDRALQSVESMSPCILFMDEVEKALGGMTGNDGSTSNMQSRMFGRLLTWMNDHTEDIYMVVTCNNVRKLTDENPEFARPGRFDRMFFVDFPGRTAKDQIWNLYLKTYGFLSPDDETEYPALAEIRLLDQDFTGAEIMSACHQARLTGDPIVNIAKNLPILAHIAQDRVSADRAWAHQKAYAAEYPGLYDREKHSQTLKSLDVRPQRKVGAKRQSPAKS